MNVGLRRYSKVVAAATLFLIFAGGMVTSTGSGLAVPDWPLSYGMVFPPMVGGIFYEHGHRMVAATVALMMAVLGIWILRAEPRRWVRNLALAASGAVIAQALLGGLTVLLLLPDAVSISHAGLAELFFCLTITLAVVLSRGWAEAPPRRPEFVAGHPSGAPLPTLAAITTGILFLQIMLGALMRHTGAGLAMPGFPFPLVPPAWSPGIAAHFAHRAGALVSVIAILVLANRTLRRHRTDGWLTRPALLLVALATIQVTLGAVTIWTMKAPVPTSFHVATGAATLATSLVLTLRAHRRFSRPVRRTADEPAHAPSRAAAPRVTA